jgi:hypothetical protein
MVDTALADASCGRITRGILVDDGAPRARVEDSTLSNCRDEPLLTLERLSVPEQLPAFISRLE